MPGRRLITIVATVGVLAGCANRPTQQAPPRVAAPSQAPKLQWAPSPAPTNAPRAAIAWATAYCGWTYREPNGRREAGARSLMTASAGADLTAASDAMWETDVVAKRQIATCADLATHVLEGPRTPATIYLLITADRTVADRTGSVATSQFIEPRRMVLVDGRWLVDARVEGG